MATFVTPFGSYSTGDGGLSMQSTIGATNRRCRFVGVQPSPTSPDSYCLGVFDTPQSDLLEIRSATLYCSQGLLAKFAALFRVGPKKLLEKSPWVYPSTDDRRSAAYWCLVHPAWGETITVDSRMNAISSLLVELSIASGIAAGISLGVIHYNRTRGREPSDREKHALLVVLSIAAFVGSFFVDNPWGLFDDAFVALRPLTGGTTVGLGILLLWYIHVYGWIDGGEESPNQRTSPDR